MRQFLAIFKNSYKIIVGDPFFLALQVIGYLGLAFIGSLPTYSFSRHTVYLREQTQSFIFILLALTAAFSLIRVVTDDIRRGADSILLSRPISALAIVLGKWTGVIVSMLFMGISLCTAYLWVSEIAHNPHEMNKPSMVMFLCVPAIAAVAGGIRNYSFSKPYVFFTNKLLWFVCLAGLTYKLFSKEMTFFDFESFISAGAIFLAVVVLASILTLLAVKFDSAIVLGSAVVLFFLGLVSQYFIGEWIGQGWLNNILSVFVPDWQSYWLLEKMANDEPISLIYFTHLIIHTLTVSGVFLIISIKAYDKLELQGCGY